MNLYFYQILNGDDDFISGVFVGFFYDFKKSQLEKWILGNNFHKGLFFLILGIFTH